MRSIIVQQWVGIAAIVVGVALFSVRVAIAVAGILILIAGIGRELDARRRG